MKEGQGKSRVLNKRTYMYLALGGAAILLALIIILTSVALAGRGGGNELKVPTPDGTQGEDPIKPVPDPDDKDNKPVDGEADEFALPVSGANVLHTYGFYFNSTLNSYYVHTGIDYSAEAGAEVFAVQKGTVEAIHESDILVGTRIIIDHGNGVKSVYEFVEAKEGLQVGDSVNKGDCIATVAEPTGNEYKDGAHLHFEIWKNEKAVDPSEYYLTEEK